MQGVTSGRGPTTSTNGSPGSERRENQVQHGSVSLGKTKAAELDFGGLRWRGNRGHAETSAATAQWVNLASRS
jgi:hypothetical protein